ncbi:MAG TPA: squalene/phytoene synthase family protein [Anaerolineales bacterium]
MATHSDSQLAAAITHAASLQTFYTIRYLVDRNLVDDAYRAYAYFRWVDDWLDEEDHPPQRRLEFVQRQQALIEDGYRGRQLAGYTPEEGLLVDLIRGDTGENSGLQAYIRNMMAVMAFDADRRGRLISQRELNDYTHWLAVAVTEAMHYFIGHCCASPQGELRYQAVTGAHITHILRDALEDVQAGYYNIPREILAAHGSSPTGIESRAYREWAMKSVRQARACFKAGREYLSGVESWRCRIAGYAYIHRFEIVLNCIELENFSLREQYLERKSARCTLETLGWAAWMALHYRRSVPASSVLSLR